MKKALIAGVSLLALGGTAAVVAAQEPAPTVGVVSGPKAVTVTGAEALKGGPTRFVNRLAPGTKEGVATVFELKAGRRSPTSKRLSPRASPRC